MIKTLIAAAAVGAGVWYATAPVAPQPRLVALPPVGPRAMCAMAIDRIAARCTPMWIALHTIAEVESAKEPWSIRVNTGKLAGGYTYKTKAEALKALEAMRSFNISPSNIDIGCFQVNNRAHKEKLDAPDRGFDPVHNAAAAATVLDERIKPGVPLIESIGRYHSYTPVYKNRYLAKARPVFERIQQECLVNETEYAGR